MFDENQKDEIVAAVMSKLNEMKSDGSISESAPATGSAGSDAGNGGWQNMPEVEDVTLGDHADIYNVKDPENPDEFLAIKHVSPGRLGIGATGARYLTKSALRFEADYSASKDGFKHEFPKDLAEEMGCFEVQTICNDKDEFILFPDHGRKLSDEAVATIKEKCKKNPKVQIIVEDGHAANAIERNIKSVLPTILEGLKAEGIDVGDPFFVRFGRVAIEDEVAEILGAEVMVSIIGERPALANFESMSAYFAYKPTRGMSEQNRTVLSNISRLGTPPAEAGAHIVDIIKLIIKHQCTGPELAKVM